MSGLSVSVSDGALSVSPVAGALPAWQGTSLPPAPTSGLPGIGFDVAGGEPGLLEAFGAELANLAGALESHGVAIRSAAECVAPAWEGDASSSYVALSGLVWEHFHRGAGIARDGSAATRRFAAELGRRQAEGRLAYSEAEYWAREVAAQSKLLAAAGQDLAGADQALSAAHARLASARAAGPLGVVSAAASEIEAAAAQAGLALAAQRAQAAQAALDHAREELAVWEARGRRAWEDAQLAAERATGSLEPLLIVPPPLAGLPVPVLSPIAPFAMPPGLDPGACGSGANTTLASRDSAGTALARLAAALGTKFPAVAALLAAAANAANAVDQEADGEAAAIADGEGTDAAAAASGAAERLIPSGQQFDAQAHALAERIGGQAQVEFASGPGAGREFDVVSSEYVAQAKPSNFALNLAFRAQAKATFQAAVDSGRTPYFQFNGPPQPGVLSALERYAERYGVQPVIDTEPVGR